MYATIRIDMNNSAFDDGAGGAFELFNILKALGERLKHSPAELTTPGVSIPLRDVCGNTVGRYEVHDEDQETADLGQAQVEGSLVLAFQCLVALGKIEELAVQYGNTSGAVPAGRLLRLTRPLLDEGNAKGYPLPTVPQV